MTQQDVLDDPFEGITECLQHSSMDEDCDFCNAEFNAKSKVLETITNKAKKGIKILASQGVQVPPTLPGDIRLEVLIQSILRDRNRLHFEVECARRLAEAVQEAQAGLTRSRLSTPSSKGLIVPPTRH